MPREILVDWTTPAGGGFVSVMFFDSGQAVASQRAAMGQWLTNLQGALDNNVTWTIRTSGRVLDNTTGTLTGVWNDATARTGTGAVVGEPVADATQVLVRWTTGIIVKGRFLIGRQFIPGMASAQLVDGNTSAILRTQWNGFHSTFLAANVGFQVWHRPVQHTGGIVALAGTGTTNRELAVLRRRRR